MQRWKAHYKDMSHDTDIEIINTEGEIDTNPLSFTLDGIAFCGTGPNDFYLADEAQYGTASGRFTLLKWVEEHRLQRYEMEVEIPIPVFRKADRCLMTGTLFLSFQLVEYDFSKRHRNAVKCVGGWLDDELVWEFSLQIDGRSFKSTEKTLLFDAALENICGQIKNDYCIKSCYTCQYSDYSPYGHPDYGAMICLCRRKDDYLKMNNKDDLIDFLYLLEDKDFDMQQETYLCEQYCLREKARGYRGFAAGTEAGENKAADCAE